MTCAYINLAKLSTNPFHALISIAIKHTFAIPVNSFSEACRIQVAAKCITGQTEEQAHRQLAKPYISIASPKLA